MSLSSAITVLNCCIDNMLSPSSTCTGTIKKYYEKLKDATSEQKK
jgi:hypothetical protein